MILGYRFLLNLIRYSQDQRQVLQVVCQITEIICCLRSLLACRSKIDPVKSSNYYKFGIRDDIVLKNIQSNFWLSFDSKPPNIDMLF